MVGELDVSVADQETKVLFMEDHIIFRFTNYRSAWSTVNQAVLCTGFIGKFLSFSKIGLMAQFGKRHPIELFPQPGWILRWLSPAVRKMILAAKN